MGPIYQVKRPAGDSAESNVTISLQAAIASPLKFSLVPLGNGSLYMLCLVSMA